MTAYYNEHDPNAAAWLRELIRAGLIAPGDVDERDIRDVIPTELARYRQCHFFAGIGVWSYALRQAGWSDNRPVWTGSCPCQSFSSAGKRAGFADERHLWPAWFHLISQCRPATLFGEQVAADDAKPWLDLVHTDLEALGYAVGPLVLPAAGFGAPHGRHRIFFVADTENGRQRVDAGGKQGHRERERESHQGIGSGFRDGSLRCRSTDLLADTGQSRRESTQREKSRISIVPCSPVNLLGHLSGPRLEGTAGPSLQGRESRLTESGGATGSVGDTDNKADSSIRRISARLQCPESIGVPGPVNGFWGDADWLHCRPEPGYPEGRWRAVRSGSFPLASRAPARVVRLRGYGNAINAEVAKAFIEAYMSLTNP